VSEQINKAVMGRKCSTYVRMKNGYKTCWGTAKERSLGRSGSDTKRNQINTFEEIKTIRYSIERWVLAKVAMNFWVL
jgi:hypothetical protein